MRETEIETEKTKNGLLMGWRHASYCHCDLALKSLVVPEGNLLDWKKLLFGWVDRHVAETLLAMTIDEVDRHVGGNARQGGKGKAKTW